MPRNYKRKHPDRCNMTAQQFDAAKLLIAQGLSKRQAAAQAGIKESTLRKRLKIGSVATCMGRYVPTFTNEQEMEILAYLKRCDELYYGLNMVGLRKLIYEFAVVNNIPNRFNKASKMAGRDWVYCFLDRHPQLKLRQPTPTSVARAMGFNKTQVQTFYNNLATLYERYKFHPSRIFNMDESGVNTVPKKIPKVISLKGKKLVGKIVSAERGQTITLVCAMSATGNFVPPAFIFPRKRMPGHLLNHAPTGSIGMVSDSGFINTELFLEYLRHFKDNVQPTEDNPVLLILDNHSSHISLAAVNYCRQHHILMLTLPPHSSHKMQPLDRGFFSPLKTKFAFECDKWLSMHPGRVIGQTEVAYLVNEAFLKAASLNNAVSGFKVSGIWPIDSHIFSDEDFAAASVTDMHLESNIEKTTTPPANITPNNVAPVSAPEVAEIIPSMPVPTTVSSDNLSSAAPQPFEIVAEPLANVQSEPVPIQDTDETHTQKSLEVLELPSSKDVIPLTTIQPFPKAQMQNRRRKGKKSIIATDSPYKTELEEKQKEAEEKIARKRPRLNLNQGSNKTDNNKTNTAKSKTKTAKSKTKTAKSKTKTAKSKTAKDKTAKKCNNTASSKEPVDENDYYCPLCNGKYEDPPTEDWIKCSLCNSWWHEQCTSFEQGNFTCDKCTA